MFLDWVRPYLLYKILFIETRSLIRRLILARERETNTTTTSVQVYNWQENEYTMPDRSLRPNWIFANTFLSGSKSPFFKIRKKNHFPESF